MISMHEFEELKAFTEDAIKKAVAGRDEFWGKKFEELKNAVTGREAEKDWYTPEDVGKLIKVRAETIRKNYITTGELKAEKVPGTGRLRISRDEYVRFRNEQSFLKGV